MTHTDAGFGLSVLVDGKPLTEYTHNERIYVAAPIGAVYELALTAPADGARYLFVASVDGLSIMDGQPAGSPANQHNGYILRGQSTRIPGFRLDDSNVAQFKFGAVDDAYAAKMGHPTNVGVIGCRIFREKPKPPPMPAAAPGPVLRSAHDVGTEFGQQAEHKVRRVPFEVGELVHTLVIEYASPQSLIEAGIVPASVLGDVDPFPGDADGSGAPPPPGWRSR
ncbi:MAG: hypothetical protein KDD84_13640 [Caldilineaceae bacterium]|nr:hypothetical protein [Caldilineaceae bacterium]